MSEHWRASDDPPHRLADSPIVLRRGAVAIAALAVTTIVTRGVEVAPQLNQFSSDVSYTAVSSDWP